MALGHGLQDAQKTMGVIFLALVTGGYVSADDDIPLWVILAAATAISLGTYSGGWRIMRTLGRRIIHLDPPRGFAAETTAASCSTSWRSCFEAPISTTHTITSSVMGVGATKRFSRRPLGRGALDRDRLGADHSRWPAWPPPRLLGLPLPRPASPGRRRSRAYWPPAGRRSRPAPRRRTATGQPKRPEM